MNAGVLSQMGENGLLHPVAYFAKRITPAKYYYEIYDKEFLAIICYFEKWRPELENTGLPVKVLTDHKELEYFMTTKKLTPRQVRWAKFLSEFNFVISYQSGKKNDKVDTLTRKLNKRPTENKNKQQKHCMHVLLPPNWINQLAELQPIEESEGDNQINFDTDSNASDKTSLLPEQVIESNWHNKLYSKICLYLANLKRLDKSKVYLKGPRVKNGLLMKENQLWVANKNQLQLEVIKEIYNQSATTWSHQKNLQSISSRSS